MYHLFHACSIFNYRVFNYLTYCRIFDYNKHNKRAKIRYNVVQITYLLEAFGFEEYKFVFEMKYKDLLLKLADIVEQNLVCGNSMDKYVLQDKYEIRNEWQQEFIRNLPNEVMKNCIQEIFDLYA